MKPLDPSTHPSFRIDPADRSFQKDQHRHDLHVLALFAKRSKRKPDEKQRNMAHKRMAKEMSEFAERLYNPTVPEREISQSEKLPLELRLVKQKTSDGMFLSMLSDEGKCYGNANHRTQKSVTHSLCLRRIRMDTPSGSCLTQERPVTSSPSL